ncbi:hypothetical protein FDZ74_12510, partial [bacterium]
MSFGFTGTAFDYVALKGPNYGVARVSVDGVVRGTADLYSSAFTYQQKVFSVAGLGDTTHTALIEWTGSKNASATATRINLDALDIIGTPVAVTDAGAPLTTCDASDAWRATNATVTLSATDDTGVKATYYRLDTGAVTTYTAPFAVSAEGTTTIAFWSVDYSGNAEATSTATVRIDKHAPTTTDNAPLVWQTLSPVDVTLVGADALSGPAGTYFSLDGAFPQLYTLPVSVSGEGTHTIAYWSTDAAGNVETSKTATVRIDTAAPVTTDDLPRVPWLREPVSVTLTTSETVSGLAALYYSADGAEATTYAAPVAFSGDGTHTIAYRAVDRAGNAEATTTLTFHLDSTAPVTTDDAPQTWQTTAPVPVTLSPVDPTSGPAATHYMVDGGDIQLYTLPVSVSGEGTHTIA